MPATRRRKVIATMDKICFLNLTSTFDKHDLIAAKRQFFEGLVYYRATSKRTWTAIHFNEQKFTRVAGTIFHELLSLKRLRDIQALIFDHNTLPTIPTVLQVLDTEQVALLGDDLLGPAMQPMSSSLEYIAAAWAGMKNTSHRKMLYLWDHYLNFQKQIGLVQELYRKDRNILENLRMRSGRALKVSGSRWDITATITDYLLSVTTASDENRDEISRTSSLLTELFAYWGKVSWFSFRIKTNCTKVGKQKRSSWSADCLRDSSWCDWGALRAILRAAWTTCLGFSHSWYTYLHRPFSRWSTGHRSSGGVQ